MAPASPIMVKGHRDISSVVRWCNFLLAALFLTFVVYSTPHQVHHVFDHLRQAQQDSDDHDAADHRPSGKQESNCVFQTVASRCHANTAAFVQLSGLWAFIVYFTGISKTAGYQRFIPAIFQIRAPPQFI